MPLLASRLSKDPLAVAGVTVAVFLPWLLFSLPAGVFVDRVDRRAVMWMIDAGRAAVLVGLAALVALDLASLPLLYGLVLVLGMGETLFDTAAQAILPAIVGVEDLETANGRLFGAQLVSNGLLGPPLGGLLFGIAAAAPFAFDAITFGLSALLILSLSGSFRPVQEGRGTLASDLKEGLRWLWGHRIIRTFALGAAVINLAYTAGMAILVLYAQEILGVGAFGYGLFLASAAIGGVAGTVAAAPIVRRTGRSKAVLGAVAVLAAGVTGVGLAGSAGLAAAFLAAFAFAGEVWNVVAVSYRQAAVPDHLLGRIMAGYRFIAYGAFPIGALLGGAVARQWGLRAPFLLGGVVIAALLAYLVPMFSGRDLDPTRASGEDREGP